MRRFLSHPAACALGCLLAALAASVALAVGCVAGSRPDSYHAAWKRALGPIAPGEKSDTKGKPGGKAGSPAARGGLAPELTRMARGTGPVRLSIEQAVLLAVHNNPSLRMQQLETRVTGAYEQIERGVFDPELFARAVYGRDYSIKTHYARPDERIPVKSDFDQVEAGIRQRLPTGTDLELSAAHDRSRSSQNPELFEARLGLTVTQSLLRGFGPAANLAEIRMAEAETLASAWELRGFTEALLAETESVYWSYVLAQRRIAIVERSLQVTAQQLDEVEQFVQVGKLAPIEAAPLRAELAHGKQDLIDARSDLEVQRLGLLRLLGMEARAPGGREVETSSEPRLEPEPLDDLPAHLELALRLRADLNEARMREEQHRLQTAMTGNGLLPRLDLFINLGKSGYADSFGGSVEDLGGKSYDFLAGLELSQALGNRAASGADRVATLQQRAARASVDNLQQLIEIDVRQAAIELERARQQIDASRATRELREQSAEAELQRLRVGAGTALQLAQAQRDLLESELGELEAMINYRLALVDLYRAEGSLLERRGIRIPLEVDSNGGLAGE